MTHPGDFEASAWGRYQVLQKENAERYGPDASDGVPVCVCLSDGGPHTGVEWSAPLLPGVLLVDSYGILGPLNARGSTKLFPLDGRGFEVVWERRGWQA